MLKRILPGWANQMYTRFGHPIYLVGSSLTATSKPRDIDIRIILPDNEFEGRYGSIVEWEEDTWQNTWRESRQLWALDMAKLSSEVSRIYKINIDLQVYPQSYNEKLFKDKQKLRIDSINDFE